ncbi:MAG: 16S rRNA (adenine(1518)-N(6)/adenine(1519)-N(6))-dimethyltransferase RsmA [Candidatus Jorgensenbacteria bacterium]
MSRRLGQHFLKNAGKIRKITDSLELKRGEVVIEIGPGHGELTEELRIRNKELRIVAVEKDSELANGLRNKFGAGAEIINGDALELLPSIIHNPKSSIHNYKIVGNIPYYITGKLLRVLGELELKPELVVLTVQKEVAERITAKPPKMNLLAASVQFWADPEIVDHIPKEDFEPRPKVDSAIIRLTPKQKLVNSNWKLEEENDSNYQLQITNYYKFVRILFKQPRKTILNNLSAGLKLSKEEIIKRLKKLKIDPKDRPQDLNPEKIKNLAEKEL